MVHFSKVSLVAHSKWILVQFHFTYSLILCKYICIYIFNLLLDIVFVFFFLFL